LLWSFDTSPSDTAELGVFAPNEQSGAEPRIFISRLTNASSKAYLASQSSSLVDSNTPGFNMLLCHGICHHGRVRIIPLGPKSRQFLLSDTTYQCRNTSPNLMYAVRSVSSTNEKLNVFKDRRSEEESSHPGPLTPIPLLPSQVQVRGVKTLLLKLSCLIIQFPIL
jgi:hypothetical protein